MAGRRATLVAIVVVILAACGASAEPSATLPVSPDPGQDPASPAIVTPGPTAVVAAPSPSATTTPTPKPTPTPVPAPPKPTGVKFHEDMDCLKKGCSRARITQTVIWRAPRTKGVEIRVYGVTECLAMPKHPKPGAGGPCLVVHTALPDSVRTLLATAPASDGWVSWSWKQWTGCDPRPFGTDPAGPAYDSVVVAAYNASGHSIFAIAEPGSWWMPQEGDMVC